MNNKEIKARAFDVIAKHVGEWGLDDKESFVQFVDGICTVDQDLCGGNDEEEKTE